MQFFSKDHLSSVLSIPAGWDTALPILGLGDCHPRKEDSRELGSESLRKTENLQQTLGSPNKVVLGAAKPGEETRPKLCYLYTGFF